MADDEKYGFDQKCWALLNAMADDPKEFELNDAQEETILWAAGYLKELIDEVARLKKGNGAAS